VLRFTIAAVCYLLGANVQAQAVTAADLVKNGLRYEHAEGVIRDFTLAHEAYCMAARMDSSEALIRLGWMYANGRGVPRSDSIASSLFQKAAGLGDEMGQRLADMIRTDSVEFPECLISTKPTANVASAKLANKTPGPPELQPSQTALPKLPKFPIPGAFSDLSVQEKGKFAALVSTMAKEFKLDPRLVLAVMRAESNYDPLARSPKGAQGLMQLIPETAERFGVKDSTEPSENIRGGMSYLKWLLSFFKGNVVLSLAAYNAGEKTIEKFNGVPPYPETMAYVQRIRSIYPADFHAFDERAAAYRNDKKKR
jgi:soluble lytic murein transglycosylase-like protein